MLDSRNLCKVQRVKVVGKQQLSPSKVDEMKVLSEKEIREFLANDNKDVVDAGSDAEDNEIGASAESFRESPAARARVKVPRKVESRKPGAGNASPIMVGPPPPMAAKKVGLRMTEDNWVEVEYTELEVDHPGLLKPEDPNTSS